MRHGSREAGGIFAAIIGGLGALLQLVMNICETVKFAIFGRGTDANENIQLPSLSAPWGSSDNSVMDAGSEDINDIYDYESAGLPTIEDTARAERSGLL